MYITSTYVYYTVQNNVYPLVYSLVYHVLDYTKTTETIRRFLSTFGNKETLVYFHYVR